jgi:photosystem II stability/assembly factor-like uncharacterized protein
MRLYLLLALICLTAQFSPAQWVQQSTVTPENLVGVVMLDSMTALAIGDRNGILRTTDAGTTWINQSVVISAVYRWNSISFSDALNGIAVGDHRIVTTTDGGLTWSLRTAPSTQKCLSVLNVGGSYMYVGTDSGWMYSTSDTGKTWSSAKISTWPIRSIFVWTGISLPGAPIYYALTPYSLCSKPVYPSPEWNETVLPIFQGLGSEAINAEFCKGGGAGFIVGVFGDLWSEPAIVRKSISDTVWRSIQLTSLQPGIFSGISAPSSSVIYVCGSSGMIYKTSNGGDTWNSFTGLTSRSLKAISFFDVNHGFAVGDSGTILHTDNGGGVAVDVGKEPGPAPKEFLLDQNYPNPFNATTVISYKLKVKSFITVTVMDLLGRKVESLANEEKPAGSYLVRWNATNFPSGVYFYRLIAEGFSETKKLSLIK